MPERWATNANYAAGPDVGTPTKVDPASAGDGFTRGVLAAPQHVNYEINRLSAAARRSLGLALCKPRLVEATPLDDTSGRSGICSQGRGFPAVVANMHSTGVALVNDSAPVFKAGVPASITSNVEGAATNGTRIVLVGTGGNRSCFSDDFGATWSAGGNLGGSGMAVVWNPTYSRFQAFYPDHARYSTDSAVWTDVTVTGVGLSLAASYGVGLLPNGNVLVQTATAPVALSVTTDGGTTWGAAGGTIPNAAGMSGAGWLAGAGLDYLYHAGKRTADGLLQICRSSDGAAWTQGAELTPPSGLTYVASNGVLLQCPDSGALFSVTMLRVGSVRATWQVCASLDQGDTWTDPVFSGSDIGGNPFTVFSWGAANGRLLAHATTGELFASDGIGWE